jgi:hypothetical protein
MAKESYEGRQSGSDASLGVGVAPPQFLPTQAAMLADLQAPAPVTEAAWYGRPALQRELMAGVQTYQDSRPAEAKSDPFFYRKKFIEMLSSLENPPAVRAAHCAARDAAINAGKPGAASVSLKKLLGGVKQGDINGLKLYELALKEERFDAAFLSDVAEKSTLSAPGQLQGPLHLIVGGGSGLGKSFAAEAAFNNIVASARPSVATAGTGAGVGGAPVHPAPTAKAVLIDNGIARSSSKVEAWLMACAIDRGYTGVTNTKGFEAFRGVKRVVLDAAKKSDDLSVIELSTTAVSKDLRAAMKDPGRRAVLVSVEATAAKPVALANVQGNSRAYLTTKEPTPGETRLPEGKKWGGSFSFTLAEFWKRRAVKLFSPIVECFKVKNDRMLLIQQGGSWRPANDKELKAGLGIFSCSKRSYDAYRDAYRDARLHGGEPRTLQEFEAEHRRGLGALVERVSTGAKADLVVQNPTFTKVSPGPRSGEVMEMEMNPMFRRGGISSTTAMMRTMPPGDASDPTEDAVVLLKPSEGSPENSSTEVSRTPSPNDSRQQADDDATETTDHGVSPR